MGESRMALRVGRKIQNVFASRTISWKLLLVDDDLKLLWYLMTE